MKIRLNDLARELEVKSKAILDVLPLVGVTEKKTHSSSIEADEAERVRAHFSSQAEPRAADMRRAPAAINANKTKIDLSYISKPGDVLKLIMQKQQAMKRHRPTASLPQVPTSRPEPKVKLFRPPNGGTYRSATTFAHPIQDILSKPIEDVTLDDTPSVQKLDYALHHLLVTVDQQMISYAYDFRQGGPGSEVAIFERAVPIEPIKDCARDISRELRRLTPTDSAPNLEHLEELGRELHGYLMPALLTKAIKEQQKHAKLADGELAYFNISLPTELTWIPWELMCSDRFLLQDFYVARRLLKIGEQYMRGSQRLAELRSRGGLVVCGETSGLKTDPERNEVLHLLRELHDSTSFTTIQTGRELLRELRKDYTIFHFIGHGEYIEGDSSQTGWKLPQGSLLTCSDIEKQISPRSVFPYLIFANSCDSAHASLPNGEDYVQVLCHAFMKQGVPHYIGTIMEVPDHYPDQPEVYPAKEFASKFYRGLLNGFTIGRAIGSTREEFLGKPGHPIWAYYVHYGDPTFKFVEDPTAPILKSRRPAILPVTEEIAPPLIPRHLRRRREMRRLQAHIEDLKNGLSGMLLIEGEAGSGKSVFADDIVGEIIGDLPGAIVLRRFCHKSMSSNKFAPFAKLIQSLLKSTAPAGRDNIGGMTLAAVMESPHLFYLSRPDILFARQWSSMCRNTGIASLPLLQEVDQEDLSRDIQSLIYRLSKVAPVVLLLEDLQWADEETLDIFFSFLPAKPFSLLVVGSYRSHSVPLYLKSQLYRARRNRAATVNLDLEIRNDDEVLGSDSRRASAFILRYLNKAIPVSYRRKPFEDENWLVSERIGRYLVDNLREYTGANAFLVAEFVNTLVDKNLLSLELCAGPERLQIWQLYDWDWEFENRVPPTPLVDRFFRERIAELDHRSRLVLTRASVQGYEFTLEMLQNLVEEDPEQLEADLRMLQEGYKLIYDHGDRFRFRSHALVNFVHDLIPPREALRLHTIVAEYFEETLSENLQLETFEFIDPMTRHFELSHQWNKAVNCILDVVNRSCVGQREEYRLLDRAERCARKLPNGESLLEEIERRHPVWSEYGMYYGQELMCVADPATQNDWFREYAACRIEKRKAMRARLTKWIYPSSVWP